MQLLLIKAPAGVGSPALLKSLTLLRSLAADTRHAHRPLCASQLQPRPSSQSVRGLLGILKLGSKHRRELLGGPPLQGLQADTQHVRLLGCTELHTPTQWHSKKTRYYCMVSSRLQNEG